MIKRFLQIIVRFKVYMARSAGYFAMFNSAMILILLLSDLKKYGIEISIEKYAIPIMFVSIALMILWGYIEDKLGLWEYEQRVTQDRSKLLTAILLKLNNIERRIEMIELKLK